MNTTFEVASLYGCDELSKLAAIANSYDPIWRQTAIGCRILHMFKEVYGFNVSYVFEDVEANMTTIGEESKTFNTHNQSIDIYLRPMSLGTEHLDCMYPIHTVNHWRFGFVLRRSGYAFYRTLYSKPLSMPVWHCIFSIATIVSIFFYFLKKWEFNILGGLECSYPFELLMIIGSHCQHIPPLDASLPSRRIAYFIYIMYAYLIYVFYASNLLSHLVTEKDHGITLHNLAETDLELVMLDHMMWSLYDNVPSNYKNYSKIIQRFHKLRTVSMTEGLKGVTDGKMALLSDYVTLYPYAKNVSNTHIICEISSIEVFSHIQNYFFTSKQFPYKEQFKIGALRAKETGILKRVLAVDYEVPICGPSSVFQTTLEQVVTPITILVSAYIASIISLIYEKVHYKRNEVWPYVE